jgi:hypothetical protein
MFCRGYGHGSPALRLKRIFHPYMCSTEAFQYQYQSAPSVILLSVHSFSLSGKNVSRGQGQCKTGLVFAEIKPSNS